MHTRWFSGKLVKLVPPRCQILRLKCTKFDFRWGSLQRSPRLPSCISVFILERQHPGGNKESRGDLWRARGARAYTGVWGRSPQRGPGVQGQSPWWGVRGRSAPLKLKAFRLLNFPRNSKNLPRFPYSAVFCSSDNLLLGIHNTVLQNC